MPASLNAADSGLGLAKIVIPVYGGGRVWIQHAVVMPCMEKVRALFQSGLAAQEEIALIYLAQCSYSARLVKTLL